MIRTQIEGQDVLLAAMHKISSPQLRGEIMAEISEYGVSSTQQRFIDEVDPEGNPWIQSARAKSEGGQTLSDTRRLFQSIDSDSSPDYAAWGSNVIYAAMMNFGGVIKPKGDNKYLTFKIGGHFVRVEKVEIAARPYLGVNDEDRTEILSIVEENVREAMQ